MYFWKKPRIKDMNELKTKLDEKLQELLNLFGEKKEELKGTRLTKFKHDESLNVELHITKFELFIMKAVYESYSFPSFEEYFEYIKQEIEKL